MANAKAILNDLSVKMKCQLKFTYETIGTLLEPKFEARCTFCDIECKAEASNKKQAKMLVSEKVLTIFEQQKKVESKKEVQEEPETVKSEKELKHEMHAQFQKVEPDAQWLYVKLNKKNAEFEVTCVLKNGKRISGFGPSKRDAKFAVINKYYCEKSSNAKKKKSSESVPFKSPIITLPNFSNHSNTIEDEFETIKKHLSKQHCNYHNLAAIVQQDLGRKNSNFLVCLTTGCVCLPKKLHVSSGHQLYDMHAEVLARRVLLTYFYDQLRQANQKEDSIFEYNCHLKKFQLKPRYVFHLYVNSAPCGNARLFQLPCDKHFMDNSILMNELRQKLPYDSSSVAYTQTDSLFASMSCSDKIMKWNVLGLQGSLLNQFMLPVYLNSVVVGSLFCEQQMERAFYGRVENRIDFGNYSDFKLNKPQLWKSSNVICRKPQFEISKTVLIYNAMNNKIESFDYTSCDFLGKDPPTETKSNYSRFSLFRKFLQLTLPSMETFDYKYDSERYKEFKAQNVQYEKLKMAFYEAIAAQRLGHWKNHPGKLLDDANHVLYTVDEDGEFL